MKIRMNGMVYRITAIAPICGGKHKSFITAIAKRGGMSYVFEGSVKNSKLYK